jgi:hypothetical protein
MRATLVGAAIIAALALAGDVSAAKPKPHPGPDRVQARGSEFDLILSKPKVRPGRVLVQFLNDGEDPHDLRLQRIDALGAPVAEEFGVGVLAPGAYESLDTRLDKRATYVLWCSLSDHRARGMEAVLRTKKRHRPR